MASPVSAEPDFQPRTHAARERIVSAAIQVFGEFGFAKSTIQEIVTSAHVSKPLFYRSYKNKEQVFEAAVDRVFSDWNGALAQRAREVTGGTREAIETLFTGMLEYGHARPFLNRLLTRDSQVLLTSQGDMWERACGSMRQLVAGILAIGVDRGEVRSDLPVEHMADWLTEIHFAYANRQILKGTAIESQFAHSIVEGMLGGIVRSGSHKGA